MPSCQLHPAIRSITFGSWAITEIGTSWLGVVVAGDERRGLMVAQHDEHEVVVAVAPHEREERAHRVLDRVPVGGAGPPGIAEERRLSGLLRRDAVEDRAVADVVPGDEPRDAGPRRVARDEVDLGEERRPVTRGELATLQGQQRVLVGHRRQAEARAAVAEVAAVVDLRRSGRSSSPPARPGGSPAWRRPPATRRA